MTDGPAAQGLDRPIQRSPVGLYGKDMANRFQSRAMQGSKRGLQIGAYMLLMESLKSCMRSWTGKTIGMQWKLCSQSVESGRLGRIRIRLGGCHRDDQVLEAEVLEAVERAIRMIATSEVPGHTAKPRWVVAVVLEIQELRPRLADMLQGYMVGGLKLD